MTPAGAERPAVPLVEMEDYVAAVSAGRDGRWAAGALDGRAVVGDGSGPGPFLREHPLGVLAVAWSPDGTVLVVGGQDGVARWWSGDGTGVVGELALGEWVARARWSPDGTGVALAVGREVVVAGADGRVSRRHPLPATVTDLAWDAPGAGSPDGGPGGGGGSVTGRPGQDPGGGPSGVGGRRAGSAVGPAEDGGASADSGPAARLAACAYGGVWWLGLDGDEEHLPRAGALLALALSPDGRWLAAGQQEKVVCLWDRTTGEDLQTTGYDLKAEHVAWDPAGARLAVGQYTELTVWDLTGDHRSAPPRHLVGHGHRVTALQPGGGRLVASGAADGSVCIWSLGSDHPLVAASRVDGEVSALAWWSDESALLVGSAAGGVWRIDLDR